jgi:hypothetical protein
MARKQTPEQRLRALRRKMKWRPKSRKVIRHPGAGRFTGTKVRPDVFFAMREAAVMAWWKGANAFAIWRLLHDSFPDGIHAERELAMGMASQDIRISPWHGWKDARVCVGGGDGAVHANQRIAQ